jgi:hypothetical protein
LDDGLFFGQFKIHICLVIEVRGLLF